jgi:hypothetical protein
MGCHVCGRSAGGLTGSAGFCPGHADFGLGGGNSISGGSKGGGGTDGGFPVGALVLLGLIVFILYGAVGG